MIVLSEPDYIDSGENIYELAHIAPPTDYAASEVTSTLSMAGTEATVCGEEPGVPPMYMYGEDIMDQDEIQQKQYQVNAKVEAPVEENNGGFTER